VLDCNYLYSIEVESGEPFFWMNGILATDLVEVSSDPTRLEEGGFWATSITFEGDCIFAHFSKVQRDQPFPVTEAWSPLKTIWKSSISKDHYYEYVDEIRRRIALGEVYQANACRVLSTPFAGESIDSLFTQLLERNFAPYASFLRIPNLEIASATPELFLRREEKSVITSPIKGTQIFKNGELFGVKDQAENIMIVDLMRNDLSQICEIGSIKVIDFLRTENHPEIRHLVSDIGGELRDNLTWEEIFNALLPAGSVSGAPKSSALKIIASNEPTSRGIYCGLIGWIENRSAVLGLAIRTFWRKDETIYFGSGAGITWPSDSHQEWRETQLKANRLIGIAGGVDEEGWQFGTGIFETILLIDGKPLFFKRHMDRADQAGRDLAIEIPGQEQILKAITCLDRFPVARLRLSFGYMAQFSQAIAPYSQDRTPLKIVVNQQSSTAGVGAHKSYPYWENLDLLRLANLDGFDEVLLIDRQGRVGEGATCTYLFQLHGEWVTPSLAVGVLPGIMRGVVLDLGIATEREISSEDLGSVDAMVALSSLRICVPIASLGERTLKIPLESELIYQRLWSAAQSDSVG
jgi:para-aminobenzoate synthetase component 1